MDSLRARRLSLSVKASGEVRLTIPRSVARRDAFQFLEDKTDWLESAKKRVAKRNTSQIIGMPYSTREHILSLKPSSVNAIRASVKDGVITVAYPLQMRWDEPQVQEAIKRGIEEAWRVEAKEFLPERTEALCRQLGFKCGKITVRNARTRWGSCSPSNDISLSLHLMKLPDNLIDYIITHELCHTVHKNHGPKFHALLDQKTGGTHISLRRQLKQYTAGF